MTSRLNNDVNINFCHQYGISVIEVQMRIEERWLYQQAWERQVLAPLHCLGAYNADEK